MSVSEPQKPSDPFRQARQEEAVLRALTHLLKVPESEAEIWIGWGIHVIKATSGDFKQGSVPDDYLEAKFDAARGSGGDDFFSALTRATPHGLASPEEVIRVGHVM